MRKYIYLFIVTLIATSCHDNFLQEKSFSQITSQNFFKTADDAVMAVNGVYSLLSGESYYDRDFMYLSDLTTDQMLNEWTNQLDLYNNLQNTEATVGSFWNAAWKINQQCNLTLTRVPDIEMDEILKYRVLGEASFLRALNYFNIVRFFGRVPLITGPTPSIEDMYVEQADRWIIYDQIVDDLKFAEEYLPDEYTGIEIGRATKWAAKSLLAKVYLTMAGFHPDSDTSELEKGDPKNYELAAAKCLEVIKSGRYNLFDDFADIYDNTKENTVEDIFSIQYLEGTGGYNGGVGTTKTPQFVPKGSGLAAVEWKVFAAEKLFYENFPNDYRKEVTFLTSFRDASDAVVTYPSAILPFPKIRKYLSDIHEGPEKNFTAIDGKDYGDNYPVLRYADVLLMYSEALNELYGPSYNKGEIENTLYGINLVRKRAGGPTYVFTTNDFGDDPDMFRAMILDERGWELCYEGHSWFDYTRHGVLLERMLSSGRTPNISQHNYLMPIPYSATSVNPNLKQNAGY